MSLEVIRRSNTELVAPTVFPGFLTFIWYTWSHSYEIFIFEVIKRPNTGFIVTPPPLFK